jgi:hypothetical protein
LLADVASERNTLDALELGVVAVTGEFVGGAAFSLLGRVARAGLGLFGRRVAKRLAVGEDAVTHSYNYHPRVRARGLQDPRAHNFPYSFDDVILREVPINQTDGSLLYRKAGFLNGKVGVYEIGVNPKNGTIFHRTFRGN